MNRRSFITRSGATLALAPLAGSTVLLTGCSTSWIATAQKDIPVIVNIVDALAGVALTASGNGLLTPAVIMLVNKSAAAAQAGLTTLQQITDDLAAQKTTMPDASVIQKIELVIGDISNNLSALLTAVGFGNAGLVQAVSTGVALAISTLSSIQLLLPAKSTVSPAKMGAKQTSLNLPVKIIDNTTLASMFNAVLVSNGYAGHQVRLTK